MVSIFSPIAVLLLHFTVTVKQDFCLIIIITVQFKGYVLDTRGQSTRVFLLVAYTHTCVMSMHACQRVTITVNDTPSSVLHEGQEDPFT